VVLYGLQTPGRKDQKEDRLTPPENKYKDNWRYFLIEIYSAFT
jgi:hypothetical protein